MTFFFLSLFFFNYLVKFISPTHIWLTLIIIYWVLIWSCYGKEPIRQWNNCNLMKLMWIWMKLNKIGQCWVGSGARSAGRGVGFGIGTLLVGNQKVQKGRPCREPIHQAGPSLCRRIAQVARAGHARSPQLLLWRGWGASWAP